MSIDQRETNLKYSMAEISHRSAFSHVSDEWEV